MPSINYGYLKTKNGTQLMSTNPYPVGAIYLSVNETSPSEIFGGEWEQIKDTFLLACGNKYNNGSTGGEENHTLLKEELPKIAGQFQTRQVNGLNIVDIYNDGGCFDYTQNGGDQWTMQIENTGASTNRNALISFDNGGKNQSHNNMPPYLAVYMWKRIA